MLKGGLIGRHLVQLERQNKTCGPLQIQNHKTGDDKYLISETLMGAMRIPMKRREREAGVTRKSWKRSGGCCTRRQHRGAVPSQLTYLPAPGGQLTYKSCMVVVQASALLCSQTYLQTGERSWRLFSLPTWETLSQKAWGASDPACAEAACGDLD